MTTSTPARPPPATPTLYIFTWGAYARRVLIALSEKALTSSLTLVPITISPTAGLILPDGTPYPSATVPSLHLPCGTLIRQSHSICEYLETVHPETRSLLGPRNTPLGAARVRDLCAMLDDAQASFTQIVRKGTALFAAMDEPNSDASRLALAACRRALDVLEGAADSTGPWLAGGEDPSLADCYLAALLGYARDVYGIHEALLQKREKLTASWEGMEKRESRQTGMPETWIKELAGTHLHAGESWWPKQEAGGL
ncbi:hypothetical protein EDC01DRAFT_776864 [Geopyxis carbonaria]|nr:hypothetical protein EDC01DRAFT_776864 [Geopyxis carbonaria]